MDASSSLRVYAIPLALAFVLGVPFTLLLIYGILQARRRDRAWRAVGEALGLGGRASALRRPHLEGTYRGRAVEAEHQGSYTLRIAARTVNPARLLDELRAAGGGGASLPPAPWLNRNARAKLASLMAPGPHRHWWKIRVQDQTVTLTCLGTETDAARLRFLLDLACDLAEGIDDIASLPTLPVGPNSPPPPARPGLRLPIG